MSGGWGAAFRAYTKTKKFNLNYSAFRESFFSIIFKNNYNISYSGLNQISSVSKHAVKEVLPVRRSLLGAPEI